MSFLHRFLTYQEENESLKEYRHILQQILCRWKQQIAKNRLQKSLDWDTLKKLEINLQEKKHSLQKARTKTEVLKEQKKKLKLKVPEDPEFLTKMKFRRLERLEKKALSWKCKEIAQQLPETKTTEKNKKYKSIIQVRKKNQMQIEVLRENWQKALRFREKRVKEIVLITLREKTMIRYKFNCLALWAKSHNLEVIKSLGLKIYLEMFERKCLKQQILRKWSKQTMKKLEINEKKSELTRKMTVLTELKVFAESKQNKRKILLNEIKTVQNEHFKQLIFVAWKEFNEQLQYDKIFEKRFGEFMEIARAISSI
ncbi:MAG: hypothetical protein MHPSP_000386 [Paramarteilia canceri]